ncbi:MAG: hypothetical protein AMK69_06360 [Nitrospira bacterium SG8_3]|nr:MAG: hypothetical protein AMK69_06360 [Nitrospira bacterium SG8_3]
MREFLYAYSVLCIGLGSCLVLYTTESRKVLGNMLMGVDRRFLAPLPAVFGILLILAASHARNAGFIRLLGFIGVAEGGFIFANPKGLYEQVSDWLLNSASDQTLRFFGIISLILGTAILSWIL